MFDHEFPAYDEELLPQYVVCADDPNLITTTVFHNNGTRSDTLPYSGHDGIDFGLNYDYVLAAHAGTVTQAGWVDSQNRRAGLGLFIESRTADQVYRTRYGHMSVLMVETGDGVAQGNVIGISGNTGNSTGPHLHFSVRRNGVVVNPYGWQPQNDTDDPWECANPGTPSQNLWEILPNISTNEYPDGPGIPPPTQPDPPLVPDFSHPERLIVDDVWDGRFSYSGPGWQLRLCANAGNDYCFGPEGQATHYYNRNAPADAYTEWRVDTTDLLGYYDVYAYVPSRESTTTLAYYEIRQSNRILSAAIDQSRFHLTPGVRQWAYLGRYNFSQRTGNPALEQWVRLYDTPNAAGSRQSVAADAVVLSWPMVRPVCSAL